MTGSRKAGSHTPFAVFNRVGNPPLKLLLRSPAHRLASGRLCLISVTGRRTGRTFTFPVAYARDDDGVRIDVGWPERKRWWRNLRDEAPVELVLRGERRSGRARAVGDEEHGVTVEVTLAPRTASTG
jgi:deazaflavin-dependent oxidoreductase (nitroreductase family)